MLVDRSYTAAELEPFNVLKHPVWISDVDNQSMFWANTAAVELWNADSLDALLSRDFKTDMTDATKMRMQGILMRCRAGEILTEQATLYPKNKPTSLNLSASGIRIGEDVGERMMILMEAEIAEKKYEESTIRGLELLRHLPLPVCQFSIEGKSLYRNPEALRVYGVDEKDFFGHFVEKELGKKTFQQVVEGEGDCNIEAEHFTADGSTRSFSVSLRRARDPVSSDDVILLTARDITEVLQARKDGAIAKLKGEFLAVLAHDIRTPIHQIIGYMDLLGSKTMDSEMKEQVHLVELSATTLMGITNDLLDYSKLESGNLQLERACFEFPGFIEGCVTSVRHDAEEKRLHISSSVAKDTPLQILGDPNRLRRILYNLLENAIKFTQASGQVCLTVSVADERLRFEISDTGTGVTVADQATIFEKYRVGHASAARNYVGTGLGLAICRGLVEAMGGMIGLRSEIGKGSTFYFEIPLQLPSKESLSSEEASDPVFDEEKPLKILVAEDNKINQKVVRAMLQRIGHSVTIAENGQVAVDELKQKRFDLVLMDRMMPIMDGIQATLAIRSMGLSKSELPIVGLTASFQHSELQFYLENGMNDCLGKPVKLASLKRVIAQAMRNAGTQSPMSSG